MLCKIRALSTEVFKEFFSVIFVVLVVKRLAETITNENRILIEVTCLKINKNLPLILL